MDRPDPGFSEAAERASRFFMGQSDVHKALAKLVTTLEREQIPYAIVGAMALNEYGYERVTTDVGVLLTAEGLRTFKERWLGRGYVEKFAGSKHLRDAEFNVGIDVLLTGDYPGDGKPKPVRFPDPAAAATSAGRVKLLPL
jgi:hypothetical protein